MAFRPKTYEEALAKKRASEARKRAKGTKPKKRAKKAVTSKKTANRSKSLAYYKKKLDTIFSKFIRLKHSINGKCACYTCGKVLPIKSIQNGHFVSRQYLATRWHEDNCRPQCWGCNGYGNGKFLDFEERLNKEIGTKEVQKLKQSRHEIWKLDKNWYIEKIDHYTKRVKEMEDCG